jgi:creatinine amidohydrolase
VREIDPDASHASWMENFPWTRLQGVELPSEKKAMVDYDVLRRLDPAAARETLGDGSFGGLYERSDEEMLAVWRTGVEETRELLEHGWSGRL